MAEVLDQASPADLLRLEDHQKLWATCHEHLKVGREDGGDGAAVELGEQLAVRIHVPMVPAM